MAKSTLSMRQVDLHRVDEDNPWPGLASFTEEDEGFFHGREEECQTLLRFVGRNQLTVVFGVSGLGKTSLLKAGLFPRLRPLNVLPIYVRLDFSGTRVGLARQVKEAIVREAAAHGVEAPEPRESDTLWEYFHRQDADFWSARNKLVTPLLVFDQFEEIFTRGGGALKAETDSFLEQLSDLVEGRTPEDVRRRLETSPDDARDFNFSRHHYKALLSLREDFLAALEELRAQMRSITHGRVRLTRMGGDDALRVVEHNKDLVARDVAEQIVRFVAADKSEKALADLEIEPALLSVVCRALNDKRLARREAKITADLLEGSETEILTGLYEKGVSDLPKKVRIFIEEKLLTPSGYRDSVALENALEAAGMTEDAIEKLVERRLLRVEGGGETRRLELTHDLLTGVITASRDRRRNAEAIVEESQARREHEKRLLAKRRRLLLYAGVAVLAVGLTVVAVLLYYAVKGGTEALDQKLRAESAMERAQRKSREAGATLAQVYLKQGVDDCRVGRQPRGLQSLLDAYDQAPDGDEGDELRRRAAAMIGAWSGAWSEVYVHAAAVRAVAFGRGGQIATGDAGGAVTVWDRRDGSVVARLDGIGDASAGETAATSVGFAPDGKRLLAGYSDGSARLWTLASSKVDFELTGTQGEVSLASFADEGSLVTGGTDGIVRRWDAGTGAPSEVLGERRRESIRAVAFSPLGRAIVTSTTGGTTRLWSREGRELKSLGGDVTTLAVETTATGPRVLTGGPDGVARLWDGESGDVILLVGHRGPITAAAFSPDGRSVITGSADRTARIWDAATGRPIGLLLGHRDAVNAVAFSPDGSAVVTGSEDFTARLWRGRPVAPTRQRDLGRAGTATLAPDARLLLAGTEAGARLWSESRMLRAIGGDPVTSAAFSADGRSVVTGSAVGQVRVWDAASGEARGHAPRTQSGGKTAVKVESARFSPGGETMLLLTTAGTAQLWSADGSKMSGVLRHGGRVTAGAIARGRRLAVTGADDGTLKLWTWTASGGRARVERELPGLESAVGAVAIEGDRVLASDQSGVVRLLGSDGTTVAQLRGHEGPVRALAFSRSGEVIATGGEDGTARLWDDTGRPLAEGGTQQGTLPELRGRGGVRRVAFGDEDRSVLVLRGDVLTLHHLEGGWSGWWSGISTATFDTTGDRLVAAGEARITQLLTADLKKPLGPAYPLPPRERPVAFSPDGKHLVLGDAAGPAKLADVERGRAVVRAQVRRGRRRRAIAFSPDGSRLLSGLDGLSLRRWNGRGQLIDDQPTTPGRVVAIARSGAAVISADEKGVVSVWGPDGRPASPPIPFGSRVAVVAVDPRTGLAAAGGEGGVKIWRYGTGRMVNVLRHRGPVHALAFLERGDWIFTASARGVMAWPTSREAPRRADAAQSYVPWSTKTSDGKGPRPVLLYEKKKPIQADVLAAAGDRLVSGGRDGNVVVSRFDPRGFFRVEGRRRHDGAIAALAISRDGGWVASASATKRTWLWRADNPRVSSRAPVTQPVDTLAFDETGSRLIVAYRDADTAAPAARVLDLRSLRDATRPLEPGGRVAAAAFTRDGGIVIASDQRVADLWDTSSATTLATLPVWLMDLAFSPDGTRILTGASDGATLWSASDGARIGTLDHGGAVLATAFGPGGLMALGGEDRIATLWTVERERLGATGRHPGPVTAVAVSPDGSKLATADAKGAIHVWTVPKSGRAPARVTAPVRLAGLVEGGDAVHTLVFISGDELLAATDDLYTTWKIGDTPAEPQARAHVAGWSSDGKSALFSSRRPCVCRWNTGGGLIDDPTDHEDAGRIVALSPDGETALLERADGAAQLWSVRSGKRGRLLERERALAVSAVALEPDGARLVTGTEDGAVRVFETESGEEVGTPPRHAAAVSAAAWAEHDGTSYVVTGGADGSARISDLDTGRTVELEHQGPVVAVAVSPDGKLVLTGSADQTAQLWDLAGGRALSEPMVHDGPVTAVAFSPDGRMLATGSEDGTAQLWQWFPRTRLVLPLGEPLQHGQPVDTIAFSAAGPGGGFVATASRDGTWKHWPVLRTPARDAAELRSFVEYRSGLTKRDGLARPLTAAEWRERSAEHGLRAATPVSPEPRSADLGTPTVLRAAPPESYPGAGHVASRWQVEEEGDDGRHEVILDEVTSTGLTELAVGYPTLRPHHTYRWTVSFLFHPFGRTPFAPTSSFTTHAFARPIPLDEAFDRDVVADAGDTEDDAFDSGAARLIASASPDPGESVGKLPADRRIGIYRLGDYARPNAIRLLPGMPRPVSIAVSCNRCTELRFLLAGSGGDSVLPVTLSYGDGTTTKVQIPCADWLDAKPTRGLGAGSVPVLDDLARTPTARGTDEELHDATLFECAITTDPEKSLEKIELGAPRPRDGGAGAVLVNVLAVSALEGARRE